MKQQIDNLIANALLDESEVYLPNIGTLILFRHAAKRLSSKKLQSPYRELRLTSEERGLNIIQHIAHTASVSEERASDIYAEWLAQSLCNEITTISGVCAIEKDNISTDETFEKMANPNGRKITKIKPRTNAIIYIVVSLCVAVALGFTGYTLYTNGTFDNLLNKQNIAPASEAFKNAPKEVEPTIAEVVETAASTVEQTTKEPAKESVIEPTEEIVAPKTEPTEKPTEQPKAPATPSLKRGSSYAVWGVYSKLKSAEKWQKWLTDNYPEIGAKIYLYDGKYMIALCEVHSRKECNRKVAAWRKEHKSFKDVWVYTR